MSREIMSYSDFGVSVRELGQQVVASGYKPDWIVAIARGGLLVGGGLGYALGVKNIATLNVEFYTGIGERTAHRGAVPKASEHGELRLRVASHRSVDRFPLV